MNFKMIGYTLGLILCFEALFLLLPSVTAIIYAEWIPLASAAGTAALCALIGFLLSRKKPQDMRLYAKDGFVIVSLCWIMLSLFGALPFFFSREIPNYIDALFETVSGFTTTGSSILANVEAMSKSLLLWRSFTHWVGGMGVLVFVMAILPISGAQNMHIMRAESPGPEVSKLVPRVRKTALILYLIYFCMTVMNFIALLLDNVIPNDAPNQMTVFDAFCTAVGTAGTGGFGIKADSIASYSPYVQIISTIFMLLFSINFNSYYLVLKMKFREAFNLEVRTFICIVAAAITAITVNIILTSSVGADSIGDTIRHAAFSVATVISTSGYATVDFNLWPELSKAILVLIMFIGACAGSTGGGIKVSRIILLFKGMARELGTLARPKRVKKITMDKKPVDNAVVRSVTTYMGFYIVIFAISILLLSFDTYAVTEGCSAFTTNFTAVAATLNNIGPGLDMVGPTGNFAFFSPLSKLVLIFDMLAGRLELVPMLILFTPATWKKVS